MARARVLAGELGLIGIFDLGQLLVLNGATGVLALTDDERRAYLYFDRGQLVNALDDQLGEGEGAAYRVFAWKRGTFEFRHEPAPATRAIEETTESIMLEAARRMDEAGLSTGGVSAAEQLQQHRTRFEGLREAFQSVAAQAHGGVAGDTGSPFAALREPGDALLYRLGQPPRARLAGAWRVLAPQPMEAAAFEAMRGRLLDPAWPPVDTRSARIETRLVPLDGMRLEVTRIPGPPEALWVRGADLAVPDPRELGGDAATLSAIASLPAGLVLVGAPTAHAADALLHALLARRLEERGGQVLLVTGLARHALPEHGGAVLVARAEQAADLLRVAPPEVAVFEAGAGAASLAALPGTALALCAVVAGDAGAVLPRWLAAHGRHLDDGITALLAAAPVAVVFTPASRLASGGAPVAAAFLRLTTSADASAPAADEHPASTPAAPAPAIRPADPMRALAEELERQLRRPAA